MLKRLYPKDDKCNVTDRKCPMSSLFDVEDVCCLLICDSPDPSPLKKYPILLTFVTWLGYLLLFGGIFVAMKEAIIKNLMTSVRQRVENGQQPDVMLLGPTAEGSDELQYSIGKIVEVHSPDEDGAIIYQVVFDSGEEVPIPHSSLHFMSSFEVGAQKKYNEMISMPSDMAEKELSMLKNESERLMDVTGRVNEEANKIMDDAKNAIKNNILCSVKDCGSQQDAVCNCCCWRFEFCYYCAPETVIVPSIKTVKKMCAFNPMASLESYVDNEMNSFVDQFNVVKRVENEVTKQVKIAKDATNIKQHYHDAVDEVKAAEKAAKNELHTVEKADGKTLNCIAKRVMNPNKFAAIQTLTREISGEAAIVGSLFAGVPCGAKLKTWAAADGMFGGCSITLNLEYFALFVGTITVAINMAIFFYYAYKCTYFPGSYSNHMYKVKLHTSCTLPVAPSLMLALTLILAPLPSLVCDWQRNSAQPAAHQRKDPRALPMDLRRQADDWVKRLCAWSWLVPHIRLQNEFSICCSLRRIWGQRCAAGDYARCRRDRPQNTAPADFLSVRPHTHE
jgi:hypothetical protein